MPKAMRSYLLPSLCTLLMAVCAGATDTRAQCTALHTFTGEAAYDLFGVSVSGAGDVDNDGYADLIIGARYTDAGGSNAGRVYVYSGRTAALLYTFDGEAHDDWFGYSVSGAGDVDNDGHADLIVGAPHNAVGGDGAGRAYVFFGGPGPFPINVVAADADYIFTGEAAGDQLGWSVSGAGYVDNDGYADLIVGAYYNDAGGTKAGRAYVYSGETGALLYTFTGEVAIDEFGNSVSGAGDVDGDGYSDLIVGAQLNSAGGDGAGRAYVFSGQTGALLYTFTGEAAWDTFGESVSGAGDVDNDGYADLIVGADGNDMGGSHAGRAYIYSGQTGVLLYTFTGEAADDRFGGSVSGAGDVNNDGYADLIVGAVGHDAGGSGAGRVYVYSGQAGELLYTFTGEATWDSFGESVSGAGDVDNDGYADLIVGAWLNNEGGSSAGRAYVLAVPQAVALLEPPDESSGDVERLFRWTQDTCAHQYRLQIDTSFECSFQPPLWRDLTISGTDTVITGIPGRVCWRVSAVSAADSTPYQPEFIYTDVREYESAEKPSSHALLQNYPNPFNASTEIRFLVRSYGSVSISIYDILGREVARPLSMIELSPGLKSLTWDGRDSDGRPVASGVYFYKMTAHGFAETRKMVLLR